MTQFLNLIIFFRNKFYDASQANVIATPRTDDEVKLKIDACLELVKYLKTEKPSAGILLDRTKVLYEPRHEKTCLCHM